MSIQHFMSYTVYQNIISVQALGWAMSTMVVQERYLLLNLAEMRNAEKVLFLNAPISQVCSSVTPWKNFPSNSLWLRCRRRPLNTSCFGGGQALSLHPRDSRL